jgi:threonine/homoserine/homoserine lactone efflux protein
MLSFMMQTVIISLSGVMAPGAVTAATLAQGGKNRWAGTWIAIGHGIVEIPLIFLLILGLGTLLKTNVAAVAIGLIGGLFLIYLGVMTIREMSGPGQNASAVRLSKPVLTGMALSATNPYFLFWWATVGLNLAMQANDSGIVVLSAFTLVHWSCDLIWLTILSFGAFHGTTLLGAKKQQVILAFCGVVMAGFGLKFIFDAICRIAA